jgi:hypothetical protein
MRRYLRTCSEDRMMQSYVDLDQEVRFGTQPAMRDRAEDFCLAHKSALSTLTIK